MVVWIFLYLPFYTIAQPPCKLQNNFITRQSQLDSIAFLYPNCEYIDSIHLRGKDIVDLTSFKNLKKINSLILRGTSIKNLHGLDSLKFINHLVIMSNDSLENILALKKINAIYTIAILNNKNLLGYEGLVADSINISLDKNDKCRSLKGIKVKKVTFLKIFNPELETFSGHEIESIENMLISFPKHINGMGSLDAPKLTIELGDLLEDISPLDSLQNLVQLQIAGNKTLSMCSIDIICRNLDNPSFSLLVYSNAPGCNSKAEIRQKCITSTNQNKTEYDLSFLPNPVHESFQVSGIDGGVSFFIYNQVGALVQKGSTAGDVDVSGLPQGMYVLTLTGVTSSDKTVFRFVKM
jgi:hypothetical protein